MAKSSAAGCGALDQHVFDEVRDARRRGPRRGGCARCGCNRCRRPRLGSELQDRLQQRSQHLGQEGRVLHADFFRLQPRLQVFSGPVAGSQQLLHGRVELFIGQAIGRGKLALLAQQTNTTLQCQHIVQGAVAIRRDG